MSRLNLNKQALWNEVCCKENHRVNPDNWKFNICSHEQFIRSYIGPGSINDRGDQFLDKNIPMLSSFSAYVKHSNSPEADMIRSYEKYRVSKIARPTPVSIMMAEKRPKSMKSTFDRNIESNNEEEKVKKECETDNCCLLPKIRSPPVSPFYNSLNFKGDILRKKHNTLKVYSSIADYNKSGLGASNYFRNNTSSENNGLINNINNTTVFSNCKYDLLRKDNRKGAIEEPMVPGCKCAWTAPIPAKTAAIMEILYQKKNTRLSNKKKNTTSGDYGWMPTSVNMDEFKNPRFEHKLPQSDVTKKN